MDVRHHTPRTRWPAALVLAVGLVTAAAVPARAVQSIDRPRSTNVGHDFGINWDAFGAPMNGGHLYWDVTGQNVSTALEGWQYWKNVAGITASIQVEYHDAAGNFLALRESTPYAPPTNAMQQRWVDIRVRQPADRPRAREAQRAEHRRCLADDRQHQVVAVS